MGGMVQNVADIVVLVLLFGLTIFVHELGHFLVALRFGMVVEVFSLGFGPAIWKKKIRGITYKIGWIPVGGYVALPQLDPTGMATVQGSGEKEGSEGEKTEKKAEPPKEYPPTRPLYKVCVAVAGAAGNIVLALILALVVYLNPNSVTDEGSTVLASVSTNSAAYAAGVRPGDEVLAVNGNKVRSFYEFMIECHLACGKTNQVDLLVKSTNGVSTVKLPAVQDDLGIPKVQGLEPSSLCLVHTIITDSPAYKAGIRTNDVIRNVDGVAVQSSQHFIRLLAGRAGQELPVTVQRGSSSLQLTLRPSTNREYAKIFAQQLRTGKDTGSIPLSLQGSLCVVDAVTKGSPAEKAGIKESDIVKNVAGVRIENHLQFSEVVTNYLNREIPIVLERDGVEISVTVMPLMGMVDGKPVKPMVGIAPGADLLGRIPGYEYSTGMGVGYNSPVWMQFKNPFRQLKGDAEMIIRVLAGLLNPKEAGQAARGLGGPLSIFVTLWLSIQVSWLNGAGFLRFLNVNLAILNMLPLPVLDGGHVVFAMWEAVTRRKPNPKFINILVNIFASLLIALFVLLIFRDTRFIRKIFFSKSSADVQYVPAPVAGTNAAPTEAAAGATNVSNPK